MVLRGYDSYMVSLGDEMRGERACLGKTLEDAERDMRIKTHVLEAIECANLDGFPNHSVIAGYVRSYAKYLSMDPDECFERFCVESGYESPNALMRAPDRRGSQAGALRAPVGSQLGSSRFSPAPARRSRAPVSLGALASALVLVVLTGGLSYGAYALLQDLQRVGFAPLPAAPEVVASAPLINVPADLGAADNRPSVEDYSGTGALGAIVLSEELTPVSLARREGPISAINPATAGLFRDRKAPEPSLAALPTQGVPAAIDLVTAELQEDAPVIQDKPKGISLLAAENSWVRIRDSGSGVLWEGILGAGESFVVPEHAADPTLRAGNAGGVFIYVDGVAHGPVGRPGRVAKGISLRADDVKASVPLAATGQIDPSHAISGQIRADVSPSLQ